MEIPEDIMQVADNVCFDVSISITEAAAVEIIARAILAERERCAKIADKWQDYTACDDGPDPYDEYEAGIRSGARSVATAIRTPSTGEEQ